MDPLPKSKKKATKCVTAHNLWTGRTVVTRSIAEAGKEANLSAMTVYRGIKDPTWRSRRGWSFRPSTSAEAALLADPEVTKKPPQKRRKRKTKSKKRSMRGDGTVAPKDPIVRMFLKQEGIDPDAAEFRDPEVFASTLFIANPDHTKYPFGGESRFLAVDAASEAKFFFDSRKDLTDFLQRLDPTHKSKKSAVSRCLRRMVGRHTVSGYKVYALSE